MLLRYLYVSLKSRKSLVLRSPYGQVVVTVQGMDSLIEKYLTLKKLISRL